MPINNDTKKTPFGMSSQKFLVEYGLQDNHLVGQSVMKPIYAHVSYALIISIIARKTIDDNIIS